jgi:uncharacterized membrane protein YgaE (UPF0421/DUF939 family)
MTLLNLTPAFQLSLRAALSAGFAVAIAQFLQLQYPIYALIGAVIVTDLSALQTRQLGLQRLAGTVLGTIVGVTLSQFLLPNPVVIGFGILVAMFLSQILRLQGAAKVTGYVCAIVLLEHHGHSWSYALYRLMETILGIVVALLVSFVPKLLPVDEFKQDDS